MEVLDDGVARDEGLVSWNGVSSSSFGPSITSNGPYWKLKLIQAPINEACRHHQQDIFVLFLNMYFLL